MDGSAGSSSGTGDNGSFRQSGPASAAPPAAYTVLVDRMPQRGGVILLAPTDIRNNPAVPRAADPDALAPAELQVRAWNGKLLARRVMPTGQEAGNFAIQTYRGRRVYTWWQGASLPGHGAGSYIIADKNFRVLRRLQTRPEPRETYTSSGSSPTVTGRRSPAMCAPPRWCVGSESRSSTRASTFSTSTPMQHNSGGAHYGTCRWTRPPPRCRSPARGSTTSTSTASFPTVRAIT